MLPNISKHGSSQWWVEYSDSNDSPETSEDSPVLSLDLDGEEITFAEALEALSVNDSIPCPFLFAVDLQGVT